MAIMKDTPAPKGEFGPLEMMCQFTNSSDQPQHLLPPWTTTALRRFRLIFSTKFTALPGHLLPVEPPDPAWAPLWTTCRILSAISRSWPRVATPLEEELAAQGLWLALIARLRILRGLRIARCVGCRSMVREDAMIDDPSRVHPGISRLKRA